MIELPSLPPAATSRIIQTPLHHVLHLARNIRPRVHRALDIVLLQLVFIPVIRVDHCFPFCILPEDHVGSEDATQFTQEPKGVVEELLWRDVDHQDQLTYSELLGHVVGTVQAVPLTLCIVAALVAVVVSIMVLTVLVIQRTGEKQIYFKLHIEFVLVKYL